jgi:putative transferase (TIGR04331 family)
LLKYFLSLLNFIKIKRKIVIIHIGINFINEALLYIKKFSIPYLFPQLQFIDDKLAKSSNILDKKKRIKLIINLKPKNNLEKFIFSNICNYLPMSYLENFNKYYLQEKNFFPNKVKIILSATNHYTVDIIKFWIARQVENKSKLYAIQHGANPGYSIFTGNEYHDLKHSDKLVTWGWTENNKKILKGCFSLKRPKIKKNNKKILIVFTSNALFQLSLRSNLFFYDNNFYYSFFKNLIKKLMEISEEDLVIRLPKFKILADYLRVDLLKFNKNIKIDNNINFIDSVKDSRLVVTSWDATIFLQSINLNVPVMAYWDQSNCIVRDHVLKYFIALRKNNVLSNDYNKISKFIFKNYDYLEEWWSNKETKSSVVNFRNNFCKEGDINKKLLEYLD